MCGRYEIEAGNDDQEIQAILDELNRRHTDVSVSIAVKTGEIFPTDMAPVLLCEGKGIVPAAMRWGFPRPTGSGVIINARAETAREKAMFRQAVMHRRIAVPTSGFYEWRHEGGKTKEKYLFRRNTGGALYLAGLYSLFANEDGEAEARFVILTTAANESVAQYHDRMPILLRDGEQDDWILNDRLTDEILRRTPEQLIDLPMDNVTQTMLQL